jgi:type III restriction enzyme
MQLHSYQQIVLDDLENYLRHCGEQGNYIKAYKSYWDEKPTLENGYVCPPENRNYSDNIAGVPHVCVKVPTAGGKTFIACNALSLLFDENLMPYERFKAVVWLVPSTTILKQTYDALQNPRHPYRAKINELFGGRVAVYKADELLEGQSFNQTTASDNLNIFVLSYQSIRAKTKEDRRIYSENGALMGFFDDVRPDEDWLMKEEEVAPYSLINVIRKMQPIVVIDEAHNAMSDLSKEMLQAVRPRFILELTATPRKDKKKENYVSNIISYISSAALKQANMVKLPLLVYNHKTLEGIYDYAIDLQKELEELAKAYPKHYLRPIVLLQAQPKSQSEEKETFDKIKQKLLERGIKTEQIRIKTAAIDEISSEDLMSQTCEVRYIITVDALKEGWDCPFAYILASVANKTSEVAIEQIVGRILRKPYARHHQEDLLNMSYVLTSSSEFQTVLKKIAEALNGQGFDKNQMQVIEEKPYESNTLFSNLEKVAEQQKETEQATTSAESEKETEDNFSQVTDSEISSVSTILNEARESYNKSEEQLQIAVQQNTVNIPDEAKVYNPMATIKKEYQEVAKGILLPKFHFPSANAINTVWKELYFEYLLEDFDIMKKGADIDFEALNIDLYEFDVRPNANMQVEESAVQYQKASDVMQKKFAEALAHQSPQGQRNSLVKKFMENLNIKGCITNPYSNCNPARARSPYRV